MVAGLPVTMTATLQVRAISRNHLGSRTKDGAVEVLASQPTTVENDERFHNKQEHMTQIGNKTNAIKLQGKTSLYTRPQLQ